ncbi:MAG TPA: S9 family peptidase [Candidatus Limnocylindria bacterium]|nr:S9 family peptidase [Candidatus Limnocylindria bacterium]
MPTIAPYGSWRSPITAELLARGGVNISWLTASGDDLYWIEGRPQEGGRDVLVRRTPDGLITDVIPREFNARTRVHEYGGGAVAVRGATAVLSNFADQRLYRVDGEVAPVPITAEPPTPSAHRYADGVIAPDGATLVCVRERHEASEVVNEIVSLPLDGSAMPRVLVSGHDFFSTPRLSPDGRALAWLAWDHPNMPWDGSELFVAELRRDGGPGKLRRVAGSREESIFQPQWSPAGALFFVSDRTGWWNLYRERDGAITPLATMAAEFGLPQWTFGLSTYTFLADGRIACFYVKDGLRHLAIVDPDARRVTDVAAQFTFVAHPTRLGDRIAFIGGSASEAPAVVVIDPNTGAHEVVRRSLAYDIEPTYLSAAQPIEFPTEGGRSAHALYYPPRNQDFAATDREKPPLLVLSHGGPTSMTLGVLQPAIQYWTSRGFAVVDVNYGGSTGFGREYRERLNGQWGVVDLADCVNAARFLCESGRVDGRRMAIRGGSAGGYTTLCALVFTDVFATGASYFGVADLAALARDTHKFESRYLDRMVGAYPEAEETYRARSPVHFFDRLERPVIVFQGLDDKVVPPSQAEMLVDALRRKGLPFAYVGFAGEGHGFRRSENIKRAMEAELFFYSAILGFPLGDVIEPVTIENRPFESGSPANS